MMRSLIIVTAMLAGCVAPRVIQPSVRAAAADAPVVVVLTSSNNRLYEEPITAFQNQLEGHATVYIETLTAEGGLAEAVEAVKPQLIFALGSQASTFARQHFPEVPLLFAMVVNHGRLKELAAPEVMGIALEVPPTAEFTQFKLVVPSMNRVLALYEASHSSDVIANATKSARTLGITLIAIPVHNLEDVKARYAEHGHGIDTIWLLNDPVVMNPASFAYLREVAGRDHVALVSSLSEKFAKAGALMSVSVDLSSLGFQASAMALSALSQDKKPAEIGVQPPIGARLVLNMAVAHELGLQVSEEVLPFVSEVIVSSSTAPDAKNR